MDQRRTAAGGGRGAPGAAALLAGADGDAPLARKAQVRGLAERIWAGAYRPSAELVAGALLDWAGDPFPVTRTLA